MERKHSFGGSALDRHIFDFEPDGDEGTPDAAPAPTAPSSPGVAEPVTPAEAPAAAFTPEQIAALQGNPEFQQFLADEAGTIAEARLNQILEQGGQRPAPQTPGAPVDLNQFLDPLGDNFGANLATVLSMLTQNIDQRVTGALAPFTQQHEAAEAAGHDELLKTTITEMAGDGLRGGDAAVSRIMAAVRGQFMPEATRVYGQTDRAAQVAIERAIKAERDYQATITGTGLSEQQQHLAALNGARGDLNGLGSGSGVVTLNDTPLSSRERVMKYAPLIQTARG